MHAFSFSNHRLMPRRERKNQKQAALQLLALSGVIRPGHVELRYPTSLISRTPNHAQRVTSQHPLIQPFPLRSLERNIGLHLKQIWHRVRSLGMTSQKPAAGQNDRSTCAV
jgi:hypothetical protein